MKYDHYGDNKRRFYLFQTRLRLFALALIALLILLLSGRAQARIITNPGFESSVAGTQINLRRRDAAIGAIRWVFQNTPGADGGWAPGATGNVSFCVRVEP